MPLSPRILIVDDDPACRRILKKFLEKDGYEVLCAGDGHLGLAAAREQKPDLILCDWMMPGLDGLQVCQALKEDPALQDTFFIFLTALEKSFMDTGISQGADDFITKPIDPLEVRAKVKAGVRLSLSRQTLLDQAQRDGLTGLFNRRYWEKFLEEACRGEAPFLLAMLDVDHFKMINDHWGHQVGDDFLTALGRLWTAHLQPGEIMARLGGDEFTSLLRRSFPEARALRRQVEQELTAAFPGLPVGLSLGCARFHHRQPATPALLTAQADRGLYQDKRRRQPRSLKLGELRQS